MLPNFTPDEIEELHAFFVEPTKENKLPIQQNPAIPLKPIISEEQLALLSRRVYKSWLQSK